MQTALYSSDDWKNSFSNGDIRCLLYLAYEKGKLNELQNKLDKQVLQEIKQRALEEFGCSPEIKEIKSWLDSLRFDSTPPQLAVTDDSDSISNDDNPSNTQNPSTSYDTAVNFSQTRNPSDATTISEPIPQSSNKKPLHKSWGGRTIATVGIIAGIVYIISTLALTASFLPFLVPSLAPFFAPLPTLSTAAIICISGVVRIICAETLNMSITNEQQLATQEQTQDLTQNQKSLQDANLINDLHTRSAATKSSEMSSSRSTLHQSLIDSY